MTKILLSLPLCLILAACGKSESAASNSANASVAANTSVSASPDSEENPSSSVSTPSTSNTFTSTSSSATNTTTPGGTASVNAGYESVSATTQAYSSDQSSRKVSIVIKNAPSAGYYTGIAIEKENTSVASANFLQNSNTTDMLNIQFASGDSIDEGIHSNKVTFSICHDEQCNNHFEGSPVVVSTTLTSISGTASVALSEDSISVVGNSAEAIKLEQSIVPVSVSGISPLNIFVEIEEQEDVAGISDATYQVLDSGLDLLVNFTDPQSLPVGDYTSTYTANICYDSSCKYPIAGSPLTLGVNYKVNDIPPDSGTTNPDARTELNHNVIDAEYSVQLNAVAIASSLPTNAVYIYKLDDLSDVSEIPLDLVPTAISVANAGDSNKIAVGHDSKITFIDFNESAPASTSKKILNATIDVYDLTATDSAVYAVPRVDQWEKLHRIDVADNSMTESDHPGIRAASKIKMHPDLKAVYLADRGISPSDIEKIDIQTAPPTYVSDSPYHGDHAMCGDLWIGNEGNRIYTACGNTFMASEAESQDMTYTGKLPLLTMDDFSNSEYKVSSVAESSSKNEIVVLESDPYYNCESNPNEACTYTLSYFSKDFLSRVSTSVFGRISVQGSAYIEKPAFVFYNNDGTSVFAISQLLGIATQKSFILEYNR